MEKQQQEIPFSIDDYKLRTPIVESICGRPKVGKSTYAAKHPNSFVIDFANVAMGLRKIELLHNPAQTEGEAYFSVAKVIPADQLDKRYRFVTTYAEFESAIKAALVWKEEIIKTALDSGKKPGNAWLVIDDTARWRAFCVINWMKLNAGKTRKTGTKMDWPVKEEWGVISQEMNDKINELKAHFNVVLIHRMKSDYETGEWLSTPYPPGTDYTCPISLELYKEDDIASGKKKRYIKVLGCSYFDDCGDKVTTVFENPDPVNVLMQIGMPRHCF